jgi:hypothetical protein
MGNKAISWFVKFWRRQSVYVPFWMFYGFFFLESFFLLITWWEVLVQKAKDWWLRCDAEELWLWTQFRILMFFGIGMSPPLEI